MVILKMFICNYHRIKTDNPKLVCKLLKSIHRLKQSSRQWFAKWSNASISKGYVQSSFDNSLFTKKFGNFFVAILVYVDDVIFAGNNLQESTYIKAFLNNNFKIKDLGTLKYFLGIEVACTSTGIRISRKKTYAWHHDRNWTSCSQARLHSHA